MRINDDDDDDDDDEILSVLVYLANSDDCILATLNVQHYLCMFYVTCI